MISKWTNQLTQKCSKLLNYSNMLDLIDENKKQMNKMNRLQKISSRASKMWLFGKIINFILYVSEGSEYMGMHVIVYCFFTGISDEGFSVVLTKVKRENEPLR